LEKSKYAARNGVGKRHRRRANWKTESGQSPDLYEENNCGLPMQRRRFCMKEDVSLADGFAIQA
jgi:hypothetical protein